MSWQIIVAAIGFGAGAEGLRQYQRWKSRRRDRLYQERNAGFWTDGRVYLAEAAVVFAVLGVPFSAMALVSSWSLWRLYAVLLAYAAGSFLLMRGLNRYQGP